MKIGIKTCSGREYASLSHFEPLESLQLRPQQIRSLFSCILFVLSCENTMNATIGASVEEAEISTGMFLICASPVLVVLPPAAPCRANQNPTTAPQNPGQSRRRLGLQIRNSSR